jgi:hypothetical protein
MLLKFYSALGTYILSYNNDNVYVNLYIGSKINTQDFTLNQTERKIIFDSKGANKKLHLIIPEYAENFELLINGKAIDYKVENALLKSALGYKTKEVKVTTTMRHGKVVETIKEVTDKEQAPNVSAIQCWLYNRLPQKWKNMNSRSNILEDMDEDTSIHVTVTRASKQNTQSQNSSEIDDNDTEWQEDINSSIEIRKSTEEERTEAEKKKAVVKSEGNSNVATKVESEAEDDLDYWPEDWEDEEEWED